MPVQLQAPLQQFPFPVHDAPVESLHDPAQQVCGAVHPPQLIVCPQLLTTSPHLPEQVVLVGSGVQQLPWTQT